MYIVCKHKYCILIVLLVISGVNIIFAQKNENYQGFNDVLLKSKQDYTKVKSFFTLNQKFSLNSRKTYLDTINFEHKNEYFFNLGPRFEILSNGQYIIASENDETELYLYDRNGIFLKKVARHGQGPGEVMGDIAFSKKQNRIYVSEGDQRKIIIFDNNGEFIKEVRNVRHWAGRSFAVSPISNRYFYFHLFPGSKAKPLTLGDLEFGMQKQFGEIEKQNKIAMHIGGMSCLAFNEKGYLFVNKPAEYGFEIFDDKGSFIGKVTLDKPRFFSEPSDREIKRIEKDHFYSLELYYNYTSSQDVFYLGKNLLLFSYYRRYLVNGKRITFDFIKSKLNQEIPEMRFESHFEIWKTNGEFIGRSEIVGKNPGIHYAENGCFYFWEYTDGPGSDGLYANPHLIKYNFWEEIGWED